MLMNFVELAVIGIIVQSREIQRTQHSTILTKANSRPSVLQNLPCSNIHEDGIYGGRGQHEISQARIAEIAEIAEIGLVRENNGFGHPLREPL